MNKKEHISLFLIIVSFMTIKIFAQEDSKAELTVETGHSYYVRSVAFSPDGKIIASGSWDKTIKLWNASSGIELKTLEGHPDFVGSVAFSPNGKLLASGSWDTNIKLWDVETGREIKSFYGHNGTVNSVVFSPDGETIISGSSDKSVRIWNITSGEVLKTLTGHTDEITSIAVSADGKFIASGSIDKTIKIWDLKSGRELKTFAGHTAEITSVAISKDTKTIASGSSDGTIKLWSVEKGKEIKTLSNLGESVESVVFSSDDTTLFSGGLDNTISQWNLENGRELRTFKGHTSSIYSVAVNSDGKTIVSGSWDKTVKIWDIKTGSELKTLKGHSAYIQSIIFSPDGKMIAIGNLGNTIKLWDVEKGSGLKTLVGHSDLVSSLDYSPNGKLLASGSFDETVKLWDAVTGEELKTFKGHSLNVNAVSFSPDARIIASASSDKTIKLWDVESGKLIKTLTGHSEDVDSVAFSPNGEMLASGSSDKTVKLWDIKSGAELKNFSGHNGRVNSISFNKDGKIIASGSWRDETVKFWDVDSGKLIKSTDRISAAEEIAESYPRFFETYYRGTISDKLFAGVVENVKIKLWNNETNSELATLIALDENDWVITTSEGRFDTNKSLDKIEGLHWIVNDEILNPLPLDVFMRQYYEPNLLRRVLKCDEENNCDTEFKPLPSIADINRVQPKVVIKEIKLTKNAVGLADVTVEVESVTEDVSISAADRALKKKLTSKAFDLRLFRDGQLVGVSTPKEKLESFIKNAPALISQNNEYFKKTGKLTDTPEDRAWREANDIFSIKTNNVKRISPEKIEYTFSNIRLPKDGREAVEFTAYAFNEDKVKSTTTEPFKFTIPKTVSSSSKKGRAFLISIGVNASENPAYDLQYAANDARKMQEIVGERLKADSSKYAEIIQIPLISDYGKDKGLAENNAQKAIIKGVFSLLAGNEKEVPAEILKQIPNRDKIKLVEPEDTLIITYSGHGYADISGIFYVLPYDIGKNTRQLTTEALQKTISSDELSLWMQDITAAEMIMVIDACHSSAAVQGDGFKPGPMGSRGLGQLAYDKDMKILSATQADNVALELGSLQQGLLSYALLQDGIIKLLADADKDKKLLSTEWLAFAERRVPELYSEVKAGKRNVVIDGKITKADGSRSEIIDLSGKQKSNLNLQQPTVFDFKRRNYKNTLFILP